MTTADFKVCRSITPLSAGWYVEKRRRLLELTGCRKGSNDPSECAEKLDKEFRTSEGRSLCTF